MVVSEAVEKLKEKVREHFVRNPKELSDRIVDKIEEYEEKTGKNKEEAKAYANLLPMVYQVYQTDESVENQIKAIAGRIKDKDLKDEIKDLYGRYKKTKKAKLDKKLEEIT